MERLRQAALVDAGQVAKQKVNPVKNACRTALRLIGRSGIAWQVPLDVFQYECEDGSFVDISYIHPKKMLEYLMERHPIVVLGNSDFATGRDACKDFWTAYRQNHGGHVVFEQELDLRRVLPVSLHGDEGKGKRRSNTTSVSFESALGILGQNRPCMECVPSTIDVTLDGAVPEVHPACHLRHNLKGHSYLQHWPIFILPGTYVRDYRPMLEQMLHLISGIFRDLLENGFQARGQCWRVGVVGKKGDLKWFSKVCHLTRGYENKGRVNDKACCHMCLAGLPGLPAEDLSSTPCWTRTCFLERPWAQNRLPDLDLIPFDEVRPEFMYRHDIFHTLRLGVYRDFTASVIFLFLYWGIWGTQGDVDVKLGRAHGSFKLWQAGTSKSASLRSFSKFLFVYKSKKSFPWSNVKGSDCMLLVKWISTFTTGLLTEGSLSEEQAGVCNTIVAAADLAIGFWKFVNDHSLFVQRSCAGVLYEQGQAFCVAYAQLAQYAMNSNYCLFGLKPKIHFFKHILEDIKQCLDAGATAILNPMCFNCEQNEDHIGRICHLAKGIDARVMSSRVLKLYLIKAALLLDRHQPRIGR